MDYNEDSDHNSIYNSDGIDSETEVMLYSAIHHSTASDDQQLIAESLDSGFLSSDKSLSEQKPTEWSDSAKMDEKSEKPLNEPLNNLFRLLDHKLDISDDESIDSDIRPSFSSNRRNKRKEQLEYIEIDDSSDESSDSDVIIIEDSPKIKTKSKNLSKNTKQSSPKVKSKIDISFGNVNNLNKTSLSEMDQFYNEDNYDSEEEAKNFEQMSCDRRHWKISHTDILVSNTRTNRYYRNRFLCHNCNERGHIGRDCPLPKKLPICHLCGRTGHKTEKCGSIICSQCLSSAHKTINCNVCVNQLVCDECGVRGHETNQCTYNWRKYHLTTTLSSGEPIISNSRPNARKCCYNCGAIGKHFGFECRLKSMEKRLSPVSPLLPNRRKSHCFNDTKPNNKRNDFNQKALCNEFVKNISSNQLSPHLNASFNKPLDQFDWIGDIGPTGADEVQTTARTFNNKNKHIKWIYPEMDGIESSASYGYTLNDDSPIIRNSQKNKAFAQPSHQTILRAGSAHTLTLRGENRQINNSMREESHTRTQTIPQPKERSKRAKNRRKKRKFVETTSGQRFIGSTNSSNFKPFNRLRRFKRLKKK